MKNFERRSSALFILDSVGSLRDRGKRLVRQPFEKIHFCPFPSLPSNLFELATAVKRVLVRRRIDYGTISLRQDREKKMDVSAEVHCGKCGSANYSLPSGAESSSLIVCNDCSREMGTVGALVDELLAQVTAHSAEALRRDLDRIGDSSEASPPA